VGAAFAVFDNLTSTFTKIIKLNNEATVYQAELAAIKEALIWTSENSTNLSTPFVNLFSDSLSGLQAITKFVQQNPYIQSIQTQLIQLKRTLTLNLFWIKGHTGIVGNELADALAKEATKKEQIDLELSLGPSYIKNQLKKLLQNDWLHYWQTSDKGRHTYKLLPKVSTTQLYDSPFLNPFITNHGPFPEYFYRINRHDLITPNCLCGALGTSLHYMFDCQFTTKFHFKKPRNELWQEWTTKINSDKTLRLKAYHLFDWLNKNSEEIENPG
jgi:ribonuclease HI